MTTITTALSTAASQTSDVNVQMLTILGILIVLGIAMGIAKLIGGRS